MKPSFSGVSRIRHFFNSGFVVTLFLSIALSGCFGTSPGVLGDPVGNTETSSPTPTPTPTPSVSTSTAPSSVDIEFTSTGNSSSAGLTSSCHSVAITLDTAAIGDGETVSLSGAESGAYYSDSSCSTEITSITIASGSSSTTVYYQNTAEEDVTLSASIDSGASSSSTSALAIRDSTTVYEVSFGQDASSVVHGTTISPDITVNLLNVDGSTITSNNALDVSVVIASDGGAGGALTGTTPQTASSGVATFNDLQIDTPGTYTLTFSATGVDDITTGSFTVTADSPNSIDLSGSATTTAGTCTTYAITIKDSSSFTATATSDTTISLDDGAGSGTFYSDSGCSSSIANTTISTGDSSATVYYSNTTAEAVTLSADDGGALTDDTLALTVSAGSASVLVIAGASGINTGDCEAYTVSTTDSNSNSANVGSNTTITLSDGAGSGTFYSENTCTASSGTATISSGTSSANFWYKNNTAESVTLSADDSGSLTDDTHSLSVTNTPTKIVISGSTTPTAGSCGTYTVESQDGSSAAANVTGNTTITWDDGAATGTFYSDSGCTGSTTTTTISEGSSSSTVYYKYTTAEAVTLSADDGGGLTDDTHAITVQADSASTLTISGATSINTSTCTAYSFQVDDQYGNNSGVSMATAIALTGDADGTFYSDNACTGGNEITSVSLSTSDDSANFYYSNATAESVTLQVDDSSGDSLTADTHGVTVSSGCAYSGGWSVVDTYSAAAQANNHNAGNNIFGDPSGNVFVVGNDDLDTSARNVKTWSVRKSTNSGTSWATVDQFYDGAVGNNNEAIARAGVSDTNGNLFVTGVFFQDGSGIDFLGVRRSQDGGTTWSTVFSRGDANGWDVAVDSSDNIYVIGIHNDSGAVAVYQSTDAGDNWSQLGGDWQPEAVGYYNPSIAIDTNDNVFISAYDMNSTKSVITTDSATGGWNWSGGAVTEIGQNGGDAARGTSLFVDSSDNVLWSGYSTADATTHQLYRSTDSGSNWTDVGSGDSQYFNDVYVDSNGKIHVVAINGGTAKYYTSSDNGSNWSSTDISASIDEAYGLNVDSSGNLYLVGIQGDNWITMKKSCN